MALQSNSLERPCRRLSFTAKSTISVIILTHVALLAFQACKNAPNPDEPAHLVAGYSHWMSGDFALYRVNPPLIRMLATIPLIVIKPDIDWTAFVDGPYSRCEFVLGHHFVRKHGSSAFWYITICRWTLIPLSIAGCLICCRWANELHGQAASIFAVTIWCFCPNILSWGASITPDLGASVFGLLAAWRFWKWLGHPSWRNTLLAGLSLGVAELTKSSWIILFAIWPLVFWLWRRSCNTNDCVPSLRKLVAILLFAIYVLNVGYGFENSGRQLKGYAFLSHVLGGKSAHATPENRFSASLLGQLPVPFPANYIRGLDQQMYEIETKKLSYLNGELRRGGWWYYYIYAMMVKMPAGFILLALLRLFLVIRGVVHCAAGRNELFVAFVGLVLVTLVSSQTELNRHLRYVLPAFPFVYLFSSGAATAVKKSISRRLASCALIAGVVSSLWSSPFCMSYFNCPAGGPHAGRYYLLDSNVDWGQDLLRLKEWSLEHPGATPLYTSLFAGVPLDSLNLDVDPINENEVCETKSLPPGWYAVSSNELMGYTGDLSSRAIDQLQSASPVVMVGYTIFVFRIFKNAKDVMNFSDVEQL